MTLELELWDNGRGTRLGSRIITQIVDFSTTERPNAAARWRITVPAETTTNINNGGEAYLYIWERGSRLCLCGGEVLETEWTETGDGGQNLIIQGLGLLNELKYEYIDSLEIKSATTGLYPLRVENVKSGGDTHMPNAYDGDTGTSDTFDTGATDYLYIGHAQPFWNVSFTLASGYAGTQANSRTTQYQYFNGSAWVDLTVTDSTYDTGRPWYQDGAWTFTAPSDWGQGIHGGNQLFWVRSRTTDGSISNVDIANITFTSYAEDTSDLTTIFTTNGYNGGLTLQSGTGYYSSTANGYYGAFNNMSALAAYRQLADSENGVFRIFAHDQRVFAYLRDGGIDTDLYAVGPASPSMVTNVPSDTMLITGISRQKDTRNEINRLYVFGSGNGRDARLDLSLADATQFATDHSGYTLSTANSYIENDTAVLLKVKEGGKLFPEVRTIDGTENSAEASEQLANLGFNHLDELDDTIQHIELELTQLPQVLRVGDNINVVYQRPARPNEGSIYSINGAYMITQVTHRMVNGVLVARCTASNVNRPPKTQNELLFDTVEQLQRQAGQPQRMKAQHISGLAPQEA